MAVGRMALEPHESMRATNQSTEAGAHLLFDVAADPAQERNLAGTPLEREMAQRLASALAACHAPPEQFERLGLGDAPRAGG